MVLKWVLGQIVQRSALTSPVPPGIVGMMFCFHSCSFLHRKKKDKTASTSGIFDIQGLSMKSTNEAKCDGKQANNF